MPATPPTVADVSDGTFPTAEAERLLREEFQQAAEEGLLLRPAWQPLIDSLRMVSVVVTLEDLFPFKLPPEKLLKKGGWTSVDEGVEYMVERLRLLLNDRTKQKECA